MKAACKAILPALCLATSITAQAQAPSAAPDPQTQALLAKIGTWDGTTPSAKLEEPYETQQPVPAFGLMGYWHQPWRSYMDTWPARRMERAFAINWNVDAKYSEALAAIMEESGIRAARVELTWGLLDWNDDFPAATAAGLRTHLATLAKHNIRPMILLNAHHGGPGPMRGVPVQVMADAKKGDKILMLKPGTAIHVGYTGPPHPDYIAAYPLITKVDEDGTAHLSAGLGQAIKAGPFNLQELKYRPIQGTRVKDGTPVPEAQETFNGWLRYAAAVGRLMHDALGTTGKPDAGFDIEVWNELTFGSNFLDINNYYDDKYNFAEPFTYRKTRPWHPGLKPDAKTEFVKTGYYAMLAMTTDYFNDPNNGFPGVNVIDGFSNQSPWAGGSDTWPGQGGFSRHYYTGGVREISPQNPAVGNKGASLDALGKINGVQDGDWWQVKPGSAFIPTFEMGFPEFWHAALNTETASRDLAPDSRWTGGIYGTPHGRYTNNGDLHPAHMWQTEVEYDRTTFFQNVMKSSGAKDDDQRIQSLAMHMAGKMMLRQYLFHIHKGFDRIFLFAIGANPLGYGPLPPALYTALDKSKYQLTPEVRATVPAHMKGLGWISKQVDSSQPIVAPRALTVDELIEYKPRLVFAGDGTAAHPSRFNRHQFAFLPFQQNPGKFLIPYYVVTMDVTHEWDKTRDVLDPARYDMPDQEFDVTVGNCAGAGAKVTAYDPLTNTAVPVKVIEATARTLKLRLATTDYPRILQIEEAKPGVQIVEPQITSAPSGVRVAWETNLPAGAARVTYGGTWMTRDANDIMVTSTDKKHFSVLIPATGNSLAARIRVAANGLSDVWPRWDEDPAGQLNLRQATAPTETAAPPLLQPRASEDFDNPLGQYEAKALPQDARPAWTMGAGSAADHLHLQDGALLLDTSGDLALKANFNLRGWGLSDARGYTVEASLQITDYTGGGAGTDGGFTLQVLGDKQLMQVDVSDKQIAIRGGPTKDFNFADRLHTLRLVKHGGRDLYDVWVDGKPLQSDVPTLAVGGDVITWGDNGPARAFKARLAYLRVDNTGAYPPGARTPNPVLTTPAGVVLPLKEINATHGYGWSLPAGAVCSGPREDRVCAFAGVNLRVRFLPGAGTDFDAYLPATSVTDSVERNRVTLQSGAAGNLLRYNLMAAAHPGMTNLSQRYLSIKTGKDLILISAEGTAEAMRAADKTIQAVFAGFLVNR